MIGWCPLFFDDGLQFDNVARLGGSGPAHHTWAAHRARRRNFRIVAYLENALDGNYVIGGRLDNYTSGNTVVVSPRRYGVRCSYDFFSPRG